MNRPLKVEHFDSVVTCYWQALRPLYRKLHAYVRYKLRAQYPGRFGARDPIPVHLLGACACPVALTPTVALLHVRTVIM